MLGQGYADSITEDMATSLRIHASKNEATGRPASVDNHLAAWVPWEGVSLILDLVLLQAAIGLGVLASRRTRRAAPTRKRRRC